jgi:hypothetical protein
MKDKAKTAESTDQPKQESEVEQPVEESQDQPESTSEEGKDTPEQSGEEIIEEVEMPDGTKLAIDELKKGYMRMADYTRKTQEISKLKEQVYVPQKQDDGYSDDEKAALATLDKLGVARKGELEQTVRRIMAQQAMMTDRQRVQQDAGLDDDSMDIAQFISFKKGIPLSEAARNLMDSGKKVIKRKVLSPSSDVTTSASSKKSNEITPEYIRSLDPNSKEFEKVVEMMEKGEL